MSYRSKLKKFVFYTILFLIPILFFVLFEVILRLANYGNDLSLFVPSKEVHGYYTINQKVGHRFFSRNTPTSPSLDYFAIDKPKDALRIFVIGSSTVRGFPYDMNVTFSRILYYRLKDILPEKNIEIVNVSLAAVNSYALLSFADEIIAQKPDALLIYAGHNEYYGALGVGSVEMGGNIFWIKRLHLELIRFRTYQFMQETLIRVFEIFRKKPDSTRLSSTLMERIVKEKSILYQSDIYYEGIKQYRSNMDRLMHKFHKYNIPIFISELVSNVKDLPPFKSESVANLPRAIDVYNQAKIEENNGNIEKARTLYYYAKDLDVIRFRAPEDINQEIRSLAQKYNAHLVPMVKIFETHSKNNLIGNELITEHLHPNIDGYYLMADAFFNALLNKKLIHPAPDTILIKPKNYYIGYTPLDSAFGAISVMALESGWPFKPETVVNDFIFRYRPHSILDSLAFLAVKYDNINPFKIHSEMADYYTKTGDFERAFNEYLAMIHIFPFMTKTYFQAYKYASILRNDSLVKLLFMPMPQRDSNYFALTRLASVFQKSNQLAQAKVFYQRALQVAKPTDDKIYALEGLYQTAIAEGNRREALKILGQIREIEPSYSFNRTKSAETLIFPDSKVKALMENAIKMARQGKLDEALELCYQSLEIRETSFAYRMIASIKFKRQEKDVLLYLERAYQLDPTSEETINNLVVVYLLTKNFSKAKFYLDKYKIVATEQDYLALKQKYDQALKNK